MSTRGKIALILIAIILVSAVAGGFAGFHYGKIVFRKRSNPEDWNLRAMRAFDSGLQLTPEQHSRIQTILDGAVEEFLSIRIETIDKSDRVLERRIAEISAELTPAQRTKFEERIKSVRANLDMLKVEPRKK
jgi:hypothetical protein